VIDLGRACSRHRPVLVDFVDRSEVRPETAAALRHLDDCRRCTDAVESTLLTITALRRLADDVELAEPRPDAWPRLRARITSLRRRPAVMSPLAGVAMSFAIVGVLVLPFRLGADRFAEPTEPTAPAATPDAHTVNAERLIAPAYLASSRRVAATADDATATGAASSGGVFANVPAEIWQVRKEVHSAKPTGRPAEPI
jgi:hypothetical protein